MAHAVYFLFLQLYVRFSVSASDESRIQVLQDKLNELQTRISKLELSNSELNTKIYDMEKTSNYHILKIAEIDSRNAEQDAKISERDTTIALQDKNIAENYAKILERYNLLKIDKTDEAACDSEKKSQDDKSKGGVIFTRWGRRDCPAYISNTVYSGIVGGSYRGHKGAAVDYLCLPPDPSPNIYTNINSNKSGSVYGAEYEEFGTNLQDYNPPCAVCHTNLFSTILMIPARDKCYPGWKEVYNGQLVTGNIEHDAASQYICLDINPQKTGTSLHQSGKMLYRVKTVCGSLPCPPYKNNAQVSCVVCSK